MVGPKLSGPPGDPDYRNPDYRGPDYEGTTVIGIDFIIFHQRQIMVTPNRTGNVPVGNLQARSDLYVLGSSQMVTLFNTLQSHFL
jgi:hypothetical protein